MSNIQYFVECAIRIASSFVCALVLGLECKKWQHTVGLRILILISISCTLLCMLSTNIAQGTGTGDPTRIAAGVVTGIGFIGGGAIMRHGLNIRGLTSAAVIWTTAALGLCCGAGLFAPAAVVLVISLVTLVASEYTEGHYSSEKTKVISIKYNRASGGADIKQALEQLGYVVRDVNIEADEDGTVIMKYYVKIHSAEDVRSLVSAMQKYPQITHFLVGDEV